MFQDTGIVGRRRRHEPTIVLTDDRLQAEDENHHDRRMTTMAIHHLTALVLIFYGLYAICRFGFGWDPASPDPPPPTYTLHIKGLTDDTAL